jgi:hypothetical protein
MITYDKPVMPVLVIDGGAEQVFVDPEMPAERPVIDTQPLTETELRDRLNPSDLAFE